MTLELGNKQRERNNGQTVFDLEVRAHNLASISLFAYLAAVDQCSAQTCRGAAAENV
jgi:hypothetical protein